MLKLLVHPNPNLMHLHPKKIHKANKILTHYEHNKGGVLAINPISSPQIINETTGDQIWNIYNSTNIHNFIHPINS
jgi:hypothetical protein